MKTFSQKCYDLLLKIPEGKVTTYKEMAHALNTRAYRAVGNAMNKNQNPIIIPCHRVVGANGQLTGYNGGLPKKISLLQKEGLRIKNSKVQNLEKHLHKF